MTKFKQGVWEVVKFVIVTLVIVVPVRAYIAQPFIVSGVSMVPTFHNGEYLIVDELSYHLREPKRGEVVVFRYPLDEKKFFIKRLIGLPGDTVELPGGERVLGPGEYYVLGDNRDQSLDSRAWGTVPEKLLTGRVLLRLFPFTEIGFLPGTSEELNQ